MKSSLTENDIYGNSIYGLVASERPLFKPGNVGKATLRTTLGATLGSNSTRLKIGVAMKSPVGLQRRLFTDDSLNYRRSVTDVLLQN